MKTEPREEFTGIIEGGTPWRSVRPYLDYENQWRLEDWDTDEEYEAFPLSVADRRLLDRTREAAEKKREEFLRLYPENRGDRRVNKQLVLHCLFPDLVYYFTWWLTRAYYLPYRFDIEFGGTSIIAFFLASAVDVVLPKTKSEMDLRLLAVPFEEEINRWLTPWHNDTPLYDHFWGRNEYGFLVPLDSAGFDGCTPEGIESFIGKSVWKKIYNMAFKHTVNARLESLEGERETEPERHTPETFNILDLGLQLNHESTQVSDVLFDRLFEHVPEALKSLNIRGTKKELALRGAKMFEYYYQKGMNQDVAALQIVEENKLELREAAIIKNMNKNFVQDRVLGEAGELAAHGVIVPIQAKHIGANDEPDFILEDEKTIFEVKWRINNSKARSVKWLIENECKYLYRYLTQGYQLHFVYVLYSKQRCEVQQWTLTPVLDIAP